MAVCPDTLAPGKVYQVDCVSGLERVAAGSVDLVFADPPFNIGYEYDVYDDRRAAEDYLDWCRRWITRVTRVLTDTGTFWLAIGDEFAAELKLIAQRDCGLHCRSWVIWYYTFGVNCVRGFSRSHTHLFHFVKDPKQFTFHADNPAVRVPSARQLVYRDRRANPGGRLPDNTWVLRPQDVPHGFGEDQDVWYFARVAGTFKEREGFHGCQMPEQLLGRIVRTCSSPGDLVLDPFTGSGTTLTVAKKLGRRFLGFDISPEYVERATLRIEAADVGAPLDGPADPAASAPNTRQGRRLRSSRSSRESVALYRHIEEALGRVSLRPRAAAVLVCPKARTQFETALKELAGRSVPPPEWLELVASHLAAEEETSAAAPSGSSLPTWASLQRLVAPAEIATQIVETEFARPLMQILVTPKLAKRFDEVAAEFGADDRVSARWAALEWCRRVALYADAVMPDGDTVELGEPVPLKAAHQAVFEGEAAAAVVWNRAGSPLFASLVDCRLWREWLDPVRTRTGWQVHGAEAVSWCEVPPNHTAAVSRLVSELRPLLNSRRWCPGGAGRPRWAEQRLFI